MSPAAKCLARLLCAQQDCSHSNQDQPVTQAQWRCVEHRLQGRDVADAGDDADPEESGEHEWLVGKNTHAPDALLLGAYGEAIEELTDDDPSLGHGEGLSVR